MLYWKMPPIIADLMNLPDSVSLFGKVEYVGEALRSHWMKPGLGLTKYIERIVG